MTRPDLRTFIGKPTNEAPMSLQRIASALPITERYWIGPKDAVKVSKEEHQAYDTAHKIMMRLSIEAPLLHKSGHPGGPLSAFTACYALTEHQDPVLDEPLRMSPGHLSLLGFTLQWFFGRNGTDTRLASPEAILQTFRTPQGLPGHIEAGIGDIPFGTGPLGKGVSNALGVAFAKKYLKKKGRVDVLLADGDSQEGQVLEAMRLATHLQTDNLVVHGDWNDIQLSGLPTKTVAADFASIASSIGWAVIEVQNGNDYAECRAALKKVDSLLGKGRPIFVCYYTTMGHGVPIMEEGSNTGKKNYHGAPLSAEEAKQSLDALGLPSLSDLTKEFSSVQTAHKKSFEVARKKRASAVLPFSLPKGYKRAVTIEKGAARKDFGAVHIKALMADPRVIVLHADLADSGGFGAPEKAYPDRVINVGVAEANMYMFAAGIRQGGLLPITYTFAAFGTNEARANARLIDINTSHIPLGVLHDCTHTGLSVGEDGETHQERNYTNLPYDHTQVWVAGDSNQAAAMAERGLSLIAEGTSSVYVFSSRSGHPQLLDATGTKPLYDTDYTFDGRATLVVGHGDQRDQATILAYGSTLHEAVKAAKILSEGERTVRVLNMACIRPMDASAVLQAAIETQHLIVVEDHNTEGGLATQVADLIADTALPCTLARMGVRSFHPSADAETLMTLAGLDAESIANTVEDQFALRLAGGEEALVSCLYGLLDRLQGTRFLKTSLPYIERLRTDQAYLRTLRALWQARGLDETLPTDDDLLERLTQRGDITDLNPLNGVPLHAQHDNGIL
ncbi:MAG: transketolase C-terminal domain-containing protein [Candidatus Peribacteraceae bacterium]